MPGRSRTSWAFAPIPPAAFSIDGATSIAPLPGETFVMYLVADLDGDGTRDAVAWTSSSDPLAGRLLFYKGAPAEPHPRSRDSSRFWPSGAIGGPACAAEPALEQIGPATVAVSLHAVCAPVPQGKKQRWIAVAMPSREPALGKSSGSESQRSVSASSWSSTGPDIDGDQRDDLVVRISVEGAPPPFEPGPRVSADLRWLDRPTGLSRDPDEPEASLRKDAAAELARAAKKADAPQVSAGVRQIIRLYAWLCSDVGRSAGGRFGRRDSLWTEPRARRCGIGQRSRRAHPWRRASRGRSLRAHGMAPGHHDQTAACRARESAPQGCSRQSAPR